MAGIFRRLLGKVQPSAKATDDGPPPPPPPPQKSGKTLPASTAEEAQSFVCREPLLNRNQRIAGYQFSLPEEVELRLQSGMEFLPKIYDDAILRNLTSLGDDALLGSRLAFVRLSPDSLDNPRIHQLPKQNTVLMLAPAHRTLDVERIRRQLDLLRQAGLAHGWLLRQAQVAQAPELIALAADADYVQLHAGSFNGIDVKLLRKSLFEARNRQLAEIRLVAGALDAFDEFHLYFHAGFEYFLGRFVTRREKWHPPKSKVNRLRVIKLLNQLRGDAEIVVIAQELKHDPVLSFKLLRYANSPLMGLQTEVTGMDKALILLGREKFYRWLSLLLFDFKTPGFEERVLTEQALSRAHFLESLAGQGGMPAKADSLFILGLFSLLDLLMGQSMAELLVQAKLPEAVHQALLGQAGPYRDALLLAIAAEGQSPHELQHQAELCGLAPLPVSQCALQSLAWAHEVSSLDIG